MDVHVSGMVQIWNIPDEAPGIESEVEVRATEICSQNWYFMDVHVSGMAQMWNIPDEAPDLESEVKVGATENPLGKKDDSSGLICL